VIQASGTADDGRPAVVLGLSAADLFALAAGQGIGVDVTDVDPRLPELSVRLIAGADDGVLVERLREANPGIWDVSGPVPDDPSGAAEG
jgi:hypothetical protein